MLVTLLVNPLRLATSQREHSSLRRHPKQLLICRDSPAGLKRKDSRQPSKFEEDCEKFITAENGHKDHAAGFQLIFFFAPHTVKWRERRGGREEAVVCAPILFSPSGLKSCEMMPKRGD